MTLRGGVREESGFTVVEMMVALAVLGVVLAFSIAGMVSLMADAQRGIQRSDNLGQAQSAMDVMARAIRTGTPLSAGNAAFMSATTNDVAFYANLNPTPAPRKLRFYVDSSNRMVEQVTTADAGSVAPNYTYTGTASTSYIGQYVTNGSTPVFTYYDSTGAAITAPVSAADLLRTRAVGITLSISVSTTSTAPPTTLLNRIRLPNAYYKANS